MAAVRGRERNRAPCVACQTAKRKCDLKKPSCSRCESRSILCVPSRQAQWRVIALDSRAIASTSYNSSRILEGTVAPEVESASSTSSVDPTFSEQALSQMNRDRSYQFENAASESGSGVDYLLESSNFNIFKGGGDPLGQPLGVPDSGSITFHDLTSIYNNQISREDGTYSRTTTPIVYQSIPTLNAVAATTSPQMLLAKPPSVELHSQLWNVFIRHIATELTPIGTGLENPFLRYLATRARHDPPLFSAVLFLTQQIVHKMNVGTLTTDTEKVSSALSDLFEQQAIQEVKSFFSYSEQSSPSNLLRHLSITITLCTGYIAQGNSGKLQEHLESAFLLAQAFFKRCQANETFIFLLKWLGYIHTIAMLSNGKYDVKAPDYIRISTASQGIINSGASPGRGREQTTPHSLRGAVLFDSPTVLFLDIDSFLGISSAVCSILYKLGRIYRIRHIVNHGKEDSQWFWADFETEVLDLDISLEQQLTLLQRNEGEGQLGHLDQYNSALVHTAHLIFLTDIRCVLLSHESKTEDKIGIILDCCADIPVDSQVARLSIFPLFHAGLRSGRRIYRDFVRARLSALQDYYLVANIQQIIEVLENRWQNRYNESE